jgi:hypothetical protein
MAGSPDLIEDFLRFMLWARLNVRHELAQFRALRFQDVVAAAQGRPSTFAFFGLEDTLCPER